MPTRLAVEGMQSGELFAELLRRCRVQLAPVRTRVAECSFEGRQFTADGVRVRYSVLPEDITPDTWKVEEK